ncbi:type II secretion system minor pseudopilin GspK [Fertoeibacter niger]|nr:type II secretion system minor pseudopilin GspK [Fertoeibacter niger]
MRGAAAWRQPVSRQGQSGVVLINVLVILALTSAMVFAMISLSDLSIARSQRFSEAGQAQALIAAGEASAMVALRRDMEEGAATDHPGEPWAQIAQAEVRIDAGRFALQIADAQGLFNLNSLPGSGAAGAQILQRIVAVLDLPADVGPRIIARLAQPAPLERLADLVAEAGLEDAEVTRLATLVTVLPGRTEVNVNTAPEALLAVLADNPVQANALAGRRARNGFLTPADVAAARVILPPGVGYTSRFFALRVTVTVGETTQTAASLLQRRRDAGGPQVAVIARDSGPGGPVPLPD